jgi:hypothetical protein
MSDDDIEKAEKAGEKRVQSVAFKWLVLIVLLGAIAAWLVYQSGKYAAMTP